jgi:hypothetical protein
VVVTAKRGLGVDLYDPLTARGRVFIAHEWIDGQVMNHYCRCGLRMETVLLARHCSRAPSLLLGLANGVCRIHPHHRLLLSPSSPSSPPPSPPSPSSCLRRRRCSLRHSPQAPTDVRFQSRLSGILSPLTSITRRLLCLAGFANEQCCTHG